MKKALIISLAAHILLIFAFALFRWPVENPAGNGGVVVVEIDDGSPPFKGESEGVAPGRELPPLSLRAPKGRSNPLPENESGRLPRQATTGVLPRNDINSSQGPTVGTPLGNSILTKILTKIERSKYYPQSAQQQKLSGKPKVTFKINQDGSLAYVSLAESSGVQILDEAAVETIKRAAPLPYYEDLISIKIKYLAKK